MTPTQEGEYKSTHMHARAHTHTHTHTHKHRAVANRILGLELEVKRH